MTMDWKRIAKALLLPYPLFVWLFVPAAFALLIYCAAALPADGVLSIVAYVLSFYALVLLCMRIPNVIRWTKRFRRENKYVVRYNSDVRLRVNFSLYRSVLFNAVYASFQLGLGLWHHSVWFFSMAGYYLLLAGMRLVLVRYTRLYAPGEQQQAEWKRYRLCGILLMLITLVLAVFITYFVLRIREFEHHEITTIAMATYTFASLTMSIIGTVRYKKYGSPAFSAAKAISLVSAIVSVLTLENAMLTAFGQQNEEIFRQIMLGATGIAVVIVVQCIAIYMIVNAKRNLKRMCMQGDEEIQSGEELDE